MRIQELHFHEVGPLRDRTIKLTDDWTDKVTSRVLFSGPNGCGKSTALRAVAMLWDASGVWLDQRKPLPRNHIAREWLQRWSGCAVILEDIPDLDGPLGLIFGEKQWCDELCSNHSCETWLGESVSRTGKPGAPKRDLFLPQATWLDMVSQARRRMVLSFEKSNFPNTVYLDAEERRWVTPKRSVGTVVADDSAMRWLPRYLAGEDWRGQLEASLIALKTTQLHLFHEVIRRLNQFLAGKEIVPDIDPGENRLRVKVQGVRGQTHSMDDLSAGEHQVLILIYLLVRWAEPGCLVLIDEPDLHLHPSLLGSMLSSIEQIVADKNGQLLVTSHQPEIWRRYELGGMRIELGSQHEQA